MIAIILQTLNSEKSNIDRLGFQIIKGIYKMESGKNPNIAEDCPCLNLKCKIRGDCVECVRMHRTNKNHLPECMGDIIRDIVKDLAGKVEFDVVDRRPVVKKQTETK
jgi:hypothetical protein